MEGNTYIRPPNEQHAALNPLAPYHPLRGSVFLNYTFTQHIFEIVFFNLSNNTQADSLCTCRLNLRKKLGVSKIEVFKFSRTERVKQDQNQIKLF